MHYTNKELGFSFDLPGGWRRDARNLALLFFGPNGGPGKMSEVIQMGVGRALSQYLDIASREKFMAEPQAKVSRGKLGEETNVVILKRSGHSEISAVHDGIQYSITHAHDEATLNAIKQLRQSFKFPSREEAIRAIETSDDPAKQAMLKALKSGSPEAARTALAEAGMPASNQGSGYTTHEVPRERPTNVEGSRKARRKWWEFRK